MVPPPKGSPEYPAYLEGQARRKRNGTIKKQLLKLKPEIKQIVAHCTAKERAKRLEAQRQTDVVTGKKNQHWRARVGLEKKVRLLTADKQALEEKVAWLQKKAKEQKAVEKTELGETKAELSWTKRKLGEWWSWWGWFKGKGGGNNNKKRRPLQQVTRQPPKRSTYKPL